MTDVDFLIEQNNLRPSKPPRAKISEYAEEKRILPSDTPFPGGWDNSRTPYSIEIMDNMSPNSPVIYQSVMKGAQIGETAAAENIIAYWMDESPAPIMLISATDDLLDEWSDKRLEPLIDSCGYRHKIKSQSENRKSRKSGDKATSKTFSGGFLLMSSAQSPAKLRANSIRVLIRDEIDGAPKELRTGEGNWLKVSFARTNAWGPRKKVFDISTPTLYETSAIYQAWELGDRREYRVPCPFCKKKQTLKFDNLIPEFDGSFLSNVKYKCEHCSELISNHHKTFMLKNGKWKATAKPAHKNYRSYQISSLYSPVGMLSWSELYQEYLNAKDDPEAMRSFTNLYLGLPYKEIGVRPKVEKVSEHRGNYKMGEVPNEVLYVTGGADVQRGKEQYEKFTDEELESEMQRLNQAGKNIWTMGFPRIEIEVLGHSWGYRTYSIEYKVFYGKTDNPFSGAWEKMNKWFQDTNGLQYSRIDGSKVFCEKILVDSGDGERTATVYSFCEPHKGVIPCKGDQVLKKNKDVKGDEVTKSTFLRYTKSKIGESQTLINISTNYYKKRIYQSLTIPRVQGEEQRPGFPEFPRDCPDHYFKMLTNEEKHNDGSFHANGRPVEALDCRVYSLCAGDIAFDERVTFVREKLIKRGLTREGAKAAWDHKKHIEQMKFERWEESKKLIGKS